MRARLSVIVTCRNGQAHLGACAAALFEAVQLGLLRELILADGGSSDDTPLIAEELGAEVVSASGGRGAWAARGAEAAQGDWLLFLPVESIPEPGWAEAVIAHLGESAPAVFAPETGGLTGSLRRMLGGVAPERGLLIRAGDYARAGGLSDVERPERALLRALGAKPKVLEARLSRRAERVAAT
ncbi:glycosyltransferase [Pseudooceanicola sp. CBS1P-1]|uniref:Glycosyltransferase n=1 Tax=Pseudooceanicola albus TaxID=2692189 RepID=A0A6L7G4E0_9RHOB|nr:MULTISPECIES: glycosyltransferase [Pseudooceanicola]MBT9385615.1 glycosyltransferase [Pseudooceanicola endophyticus]MXN18975.1 glycosyltransferase [Pseudooceanicola albus]